MKQSEWIVCERSGRWAAALRHAIAAPASQPSTPQPLYEVRSLDELTNRLRERPGAVVLVEVRRTNLAETLSWLADVGASLPRCRCMALLCSDEFNSEFRADVMSALLAAGAVEVTVSPRHLQSLLTVGLRHVAAPACDSTGARDHQSFADWAWGLLPWQPA